LGHHTIKTRLAAYLYLSGKNNEAGEYLFEAMSDNLASASELFEYANQLQYHADVLSVIAHFKTA
jgi:hypothetical protein